MPFILIGAGLTLLLTAIKGDPDKFYTLLQGDFTGPNSYLYWIFSIFVLGVLGYIEPLQKFSRLFIVLVVIVLLIHNQGFFAQFQRQVFGKTPTGSGGTF